MTKDELSLLLFLETCHVDYGGPVNVAHMNAGDMAIAKRWNDEKLIDFGRIYSKDLEKYSPKTHYVILSNEALNLAHTERKARGERMLSKRLWRKASEK